MVGCNLKHRTAGSDISTIQTRRRANQIERLHWVCTYALKPSSAKYAPQKNPGWLFARYQLIWMPRGKPPTKHKLASRCCCRYGGVSPASFPNTKSANNGSGKMEPSIWKLSTQQTNNNGEEKIDQSVAPTFDNWEHPTELSEEYTTPTGVLFYLEGSFCCVPNRLRTVWMGVVRELPPSDICKKKSEATGLLYRWLFCLNF